MCVCFQRPNFARNWELNAARDSGVASNPPSEPPTSTDPAALFHGRSQVGPTAHAATNGASKPAREAVLVTNTPPPPPPATIACGGRDKEKEPLSPLPAPTLKTFAAIFFAIFAALLFKK
eukprot:CAMPEP_0171912596 /NCGR_PEP_ID=MMETSP0993-20121228/11250_1 /TAXON_ID=483369 /ORGANISM="non described non described, Strain CCMP2098" /LENGTH=119 /DNA_ID=CAMNT_0012546479 /DNA_START=40 /DNA_END=399 /DNA_ORIENTATION=+